VTSKKTAFGEGTSIENAIGSLSLGGKRIFVWKMPQFTLNGQCVSAVLSSYLFSATVTSRSPQLAKLAGKLILQNLDIGRARIGGQ
jgi:hypothetical protein